MSKKERKPGSTPPPPLEKAAAAKPPAPARRSRSGFASLAPGFGALLLLASLAVAAYSDSFTAGWHFDDRPNIIENPYFRTGSLTPAFLLRAMVQDFNQNRPFSNLTLALNYYFGQENVRGYHLVNLIFHLLAAWAAYACLLLTFRRAGLPEDRGRLSALLAAAVWVVHPLHTQAVTYIVQRQAVMASALMLASLAAYIAAREAATRRRRFGFGLLALLAFLAAAGCKEIAWVTPVLIALYELFFFQDFSLLPLRRRPFALGAALLALAGLLGLVLRPQVWTSLLQGYQSYPFTPSQRLLTEPRVLWQYLGLILWPLPSRLSLVHDPVVSTSLLYPWTTGPAILLWLLFLFGALCAARRPAWRGLSFALVWFLGNLLLESSFLPLDLMVEHRLYLASLGVIAPLVAGAVCLIPKPRRAVLALGLIVAALALASRSRNQVWQTDVSLWRDAVRKAPLSATSHFNLANVCFRGGLTSEARREYERTLALDPQQFMAVEALGIFAHREKRYEQALAIFTSAITLQPRYSLLYLNRASVYSDLGQYDLAIADYNQALLLDPAFPQAYLDRAAAYSRKGDLTAAIADCDRALQLQPNLARAFFLRGQYYDRQSRADLAEADFARARALDPGLFQNR